MILLQPKIQEHGIKVGRDQLFELLRYHGMLLRRRTRKVSTTNSHHWLRKYPNLIKDLTPIQADQLWVSDITYIRTLRGFAYLSLITDAYSRMIIGHCLYPTLETEGCLIALQAALKSRNSTNKPGLIHHSDKGVQYCCSRYVELLENEEIAISMANNPYENAIAERINSTIKNEFDFGRVYKDFEEAKQDIDKIVNIYNSKRPHASINYLTPAAAHGEQGELKRRWKSYPYPGQIQNRDERRLQ